MLVAGWFQGSEQVMLDHLHAAAFRGGPLGRTILGSAENIKKITKKDIQDYFSTHYAPHRMVITAYGPAVKNGDVVDQVKKLFTKLPANPITTKQLLEKQPAIFTGSEIRVRDDDPSLAHFVVAFKGASWTDPDYVVLMLMQAMLGSWNKAGEHNIGNLVRIGEVAESMTAFNTNYKDTGLFGVYAVAKPDCLEDMAYAIMKEICNGLCCRVLEDDVIRAQNQLKSSLLNTHGTSAAEEIGRQVITYWRRIPNAELLSRIDAVDVATVKCVAYRFLFDQDIAIVASGPIKRLPDYSRLRSRTCMLRY
ncbi:putative mitochondrial-processing peptidase subunit beta, mitochondrial [Bidens hawaiensis]|uniref:putative mitochondrial-processing peptidase subunit beta, mitochondrial n=1 Tax=Bidens hawaiensis TaxID=980011 RepID=UPI00404B8C47